MIKKEIAIVGGGCFWCIESAFNMVKGVYSAESGYSGGATDSPTYEQICRGDSGHAEVVKVEFDPSIISYPQILELFFQLHDPTQLNRQGNDIGTQYRSIIFYNDEKQRDSASQLIEKLSKQQIWANPIVTELAPIETFYIAESYHQGYALTNPNQPYCAAIVLPKLHKFRTQFQHHLK